VVHTTGAVTSLQGNLDAFPLPDVLRLLALTGKSGHLAVDGGGGAGGVWLDEGRLAAVAEPGDEGGGAGAPSAEALFELLRHPHGTFAFVAGAGCTTEVEAEPGQVDGLLDEAAVLLVEWDEVRTVVPSLDAGVALAPALGAEEARITAEQWRLVAAIAGGTTVGRLGAAEGLRETAVSRLVKGLVDAGFAAVTPASHPDADVPGEAVDGVDSEELRDDTDSGPGVDGGAAAGDLDGELPDGLLAAFADAGAPRADGVEAGEDHEVAGTPDVAVAPVPGSALTASLGELASFPEDVEPDVATDQGPDVAEAAAPSDADQRSAHDLAPEVRPVDRGSLLKMLSSVRP
jgi:hypothetical protein